MKRLLALTPALFLLLLMEVSAVYWPPQEPPTLPQWVRVTTANTTISDPNEPVANTSPEFAAGTISLNTSTSPAQNTTTDSSTSSTMSPTTTRQTVPSSSPKTTSPPRKSTSPTTRTSTSKPTQAPTTTNPSSPTTTIVSTTTAPKPGPPTRPPTNLPGKLAKVSLSDRFGQPTTVIDPLGSITYKCIMTKDSGHKIVLTDGEKIVKSFTKDSADVKCPAAGSTDMKCILTLPVSQIPIGHALDCVKDRLSEYGDSYTVSIDYTLCSQADLNSAKEKCFSQCYKTKDGVKCEIPTNDEEKFCLLDRYQEIKYCSMAATLTDSSKTFCKALLGNQANKAAYIKTKSTTCSELGFIHYKFGTQTKPLDTGNIVTVERVIMFNTSNGARPAIQLKPETGKWKDFGGKSWNCAAGIWTPRTKQQENSKCTINKASGSNEFTIEFQYPWTEEQLLLSWGRVSLTDKATGVTVMITFLVYNPKTFKDVLSKYASVRVDGNDHCTATVSCDLTQVRDELSKLLKDEFDLKVLIKRNNETMREDGDEGKNSIQHKKEHGNFVYECQVTLSHAVMVFRKVNIPLANTTASKTLICEDTDADREAKERRESMLLAVAITVPLVCILIIVIAVVVFCFWKHKKAHGGLINKMLSDKANTVRVLECLWFVTGQDSKCDKIKLLLDNFDSMQADHAAELDTMVEQGKAAFVHKQRYKDVPILKLTAIPDENDNEPAWCKTEEVNQATTRPLPLGGNYVKDLYGNMKYIITEAPRKENMQAFMRCLVRDNVSMVVTIASETDINAERVFPYFREGTRVRPGHWRLDVPKRPQLSNKIIEVRTIRVVNTKTKEDHSFRHVLYKYWFDYHAVNDYEHIAIIKKFTDKFMKKIAADSDAKILAHCSAGIGRSGTLICAFLCIDIVRKDYKEINIPAIVNHVRSFRLKAVQKKLQFETLFKVAGSEEESKMKENLDVLAPLDEETAKKDGIEETSESTDMTALFKKINKNVKEVEAKSMKTTDKQTPDSSIQLD